MKMRCSSRRCRHFPPAVNQSPADKPARRAVVSEITAKRAQKQPDVLIQRVELIEQRPTATQQVTANAAVDLEDKTGFRLVVGVVGGQKIGKQSPVFVNRVDRLA